MSIRRRISVALRVGVSAILIAVMLTRLDVRDMGRFVVGAEPSLVLLTLLTVLLDRSFMAGRWVCLLEVLGVRAPRPNVVKIFFLSTFFGSFLPTGIGGEAVRAVSSSRLTSKGVESVASILMDRVIGLLSMLLIGVAALLLSYGVYRHPALLATVAGLAVLVVAGLALLLSPSLHRWLMRGRGAPPQGWWSLLASAMEALGRYRSHPGLLALVLCLSVGVQVLRVLQAYLLSEAMHLGTQLVYFFCFVPLILVITMLPISVSGLGTTNVAYVALFRQVGMDPNGAFVLSVLILALGVLGNLPGGVIYALEGFSSARVKKGELSA